MDADAHLAALRLEGGRLAAAARGAPGVPVPSCPGWDMRQLLAHVVAIHRWVTGILREKATERPARTELVAEVVFSDLAAAYDAALSALVGALAATDPGECVWNWRSGVAPAAFWFRRMAQETAVHRWDAEAATGPASPIDVALAADGIDEFLSIAARLVAAHPVENLVGSLALVAPDAGASWHLELAPGRITCCPPVGLATTVEGPASDLYLWLLHRIRRDAATVTILGDPAPAEAWGGVIFD
jgi:uncharacterized protein (TIGR03083 family)